MLKHYGTAVLLLWVFLSLLVTLSAADEGEEHGSPGDAPIAAGNTLCPVTEGEPVDPDIWTMFEGQRVNFCCQDCKRQFIADPEGFRSSLSVVMKPNPALEESGAASSEDPLLLSEGEGRETGNVPVAPTGHEHEETAMGSHAEASEGHHGPDEGEHAEHDHARDHAPVVSMGSRLVRFAGKFHPLAVHFPIALILVAAFGEFAAAGFGSSKLGQAAYYAILAGAAAAVVAAALGWAAGNGARFPQEIGSISVLWLHRWLGVATALLACAAAVGGTVSRRKQTSVFRGLYRTLLFGAALLVGLTGHFGAALVFGLNHFTF